MYNIIYESAYFFNELCIFVIYIVRQLFSILYFSVSKRNFYNLDTGVSRLISKTLWIIFYNLNRLHSTHYYNNIIYYLLCNLYCNNSTH